MTFVPAVPVMAACAEALRAAAQPPIVYDPRPTTTNLHDRDEQIEKQREHLQDLNQWAQRLKGPCVKCRWKKGGDYSECTNPAVAVGKGDPLTGEVEWSYPSCQDERRERRLPVGRAEWRYASAQMKSAESVPTLCGPEGLLFEPRTYKQFLVRWALGGLWLIPTTVIGTLLMGALETAVGSWK